MSTNPVPRRDENVPLRPTFKSYINFLKDAVKVTFRLHPDCGMRRARETHGGLYRLRFLLLEEIPAF
jgi:hypothetical protein